MNYYFPIVFIICSLCHLPGLAAAPNIWTITSPGNMVKATVQLSDLGGQADYPADAVRLYYTVQAGGPLDYTEVVQASPMGLTRDDVDLLDGLTFVSESDVRAIDSTYSMLTGKRSTCRNYCNEKVLGFSSGGITATMEIYLRAYDDGFAFRYRFPETDSSVKTVIHEATGFRPPENSVMWMLPYNTTEDDYAPAYEDIWKRNLPVGAEVGETVKPSDGSWCMPALYRTPEGLWALLWESDVTPSYSNSHLSKATFGVYRIQFPDSSEGEGIGAVNPVSTLPWTLPWRVVITGTSPGTILESTLSTDLASPSVIDDVSWIRPGRSSWSWWSDNESPVDYNKIIPFIDLASQMTWEYSLVDCGWDSLANGTWEGLIAYAAERNVGLNFWYNTGGPNNTISNLTPRDRLYDQNTRISEFQKISSAGAKGIKVDFWLSDKQQMVQYYWDVFRDAATYHLLVNIHGNTIPRGWQRTYPNLITAEAVRGAENYIWFPEDGDRFPWQNTMMPFIRNAVASMDWTPVTFTSLSNPHKTTFAHELALSVIFESGIQHFADHYTGYQNLIPPEAREFLKTVPVAWDDTKYLQGYPGSWVALARRKGSDWYAAGIAGDTAREMTIPCTFLPDAPVRYHFTLITDGSSATTFSETSDTVSAGESFTVNTPVRGGWVAKLVNLDADPVQRLHGSNFQTKTVQSVITGVNSGVVHLPESWVKAHAPFNIYRCDGRLLRRSKASVPCIDLKKVFRLSEGHYILKLSAEH